MADAEEDPVGTLRGIVGLGYEACAAMLARANGDVAAAVNRATMRVSKRLALVTAEITRWLSNRRTTRRRGPRTPPRSS